MSKKTDKITKTQQSQSTVKTTYYPNSAVESKTPYMNSKQHGVQTVWWRNGRKKLKRIWVQGKQHGVQTMWHKGGGRVPKQCGSLGVCAR